MLVLQHDGQGQSIHVVWGIARSTTSPAVVVTAYRPDPDVPVADRQPRPGHQGEWLLAVYIVTPANDITARAAVMLGRRPEGRFYVADAAIAGFGVAVDKALDSV